VAAEVRRRRSAVNAAEEPQLDLLAELMKGKDKARPDEELPAAVVADYMISLIFASMSTTVRSIRTHNPNLASLEC
jgi:cytochrome P450